LSSVIEKMVRYAVQVTEPEEIILFGSMVNGTANSYSDIDLLIVTGGSFDKKDAVMRIKIKAHEFSMKADVLIFSRPELEKEITIENGFVKAILKS
jgi:predicted nucleotidyltransferase